MAEEVVTDTLITTDPVTDPVNDGVTDPVVTDPVKDVDPTDPPKEPDAPKEPEAPVEFTDFTVPEGFNVNDTVMTEFKSLAQELKLDQGQAQKLVDLQTRHATSQAEAWEGIKTSWAESAKADAELSKGDFSENIATARKARDAFGTPALNEALESTGVGNHPEFIRFMFRVGEAIKEDKMHVGSSQGGKEIDHAKLLFPNQN